MKHILFISRSRLSHNLMRALVPLVPVSVDLTCLENLDQLEEIPRRGKPFSLTVIDWNTLYESRGEVEKLEQLSLHPLTKKAPLVLIHGREASFPEPLLTGKGVRAFYSKPFLADELAGILTKELKTRRGRP